MEDTKGRKVIVLGLGYSVSEPEFQEYFSKFFGVEEACIVRESMTGASRGFGFVLFNSPEAAQALLSEHELRGPLSIKGKRIDPKLALPKGEVLPKHSIPAAGVLRTARIFVGRIPPTVSQEEVRAYFEQFGALEDFYMPLNFGTRQPRGIAFVTFTSENVVDLVMQTAHELGGRQIAVDRAAPKAEGGDRFGTMAGPMQYYGQSYQSPGPAYQQVASPYQPPTQAYQQLGSAYQPTAQQPGWAGAPRMPPRGGYAAAQPYRPRPYPPVGGSIPGPVPVYRQRPAYQPYAR